MLEQTEHLPETTVCIGAEMIISTSNGAKFYLLFIDKEIFILFKISIKVKIVSHQMETMEQKKQILLTMMLMNHYQESSCRWKTVMRNLHLRKHFRHIMMSKRVLGFLLIRPNDWECLFF